jgi:pyrroline-5-carboxylate reductase
MAISERIAFVGGGNMAAALIQGLLATQTTQPERVMASDVREESLAVLRSRHGIETSSDNLRACAADIVVLSVKPQVFPALLPELAPHLGEHALVISIAAGVPLRAIEALLPKARVVRAMPNTPALVSAGVTALALGSRANAADAALATAIFESVGRVVHVSEELMDAVTALSGSGPAYVFLMAEALIDAGIKLGLSPQVSATLATQTLYGAAKLLTESDESPEELRRRVTSPGGTTAAGIAALEARDFRGALAACLEAARDRGRELGLEAAAKLGAVEPESTGRREAGKNNI